jgi:hypothetical protein
VDGAVPNAKRPEWLGQGRTLPFDGFHLAQMPRVLQE